MISFHLVLNYIITGKLSFKLESTSYIVIFFPMTFLKATKSGYVMATFKSSQFGVMASLTYPKSGGHHYQVQGDMTSFGGAKYTIKMSSVDSQRSILFAYDHVRLLDEKSPLIEGQQEPNQK